MLTSGAEMPIALPHPCRFTDPLDTPPRGADSDFRPPCPVPQATRLAILLNPANPAHPLALEEARTAARSLGGQLQAVQAKGPSEIDKGSAAVTREHAGALFVPWDGTFLVHAARIVQLAARARVPALHGQRRYVDLGGLASYGPSADDPAVAGHRRRRGRPIAERRGPPPVYTVAVDGSRPMLERLQGAGRTE